MFKKAYFLYVVVLLTLLYALEAECYARSSTILGSRHAIGGFPDAWEKETLSKL
jgi:hypothetical protein